MIYPQPLSPLEEALKGKLGKISPAFFCPGGRKVVGPGKSHDSHQHFSPGGRKVALSQNLLYWKGYSSGRRSRRLEPPPQWSVTHLVVGGNRREESAPGMLGHIICLMTIRYMCVAVVRFGFWKSMVGETIISTNACLFTSSPTRGSLCKARVSSFFLSTY